MSAETERYLILCVDRDDDLGTKTKLETPVVGRDQVLSAATRLALADPEEADANAIFAAVGKFDELTKGGTPCEVAVVCGETNRGFEADRRVGREVNKVLSGASYSGVILVSDGGEDELVIPIIQGMKPIISVERVTVKHSQTVEETYQVLGRYLRMLVFDPHYSKWTLGVPGVILLLAGILILSNRTYEAELTSLLVLGVAFLIRGFNLDRTVAGLLQRGPTGYIRLFSMVTSILVITAGIFTGYGYMAQSAKLPDGSSVLAAVAASPSLILVYGAALTGYFITGSLVLVWSGAAIYAGGALLSHVARGSNRWRRDGTVLIMLMMLYFPVLTFSQFLISGTTEASFLLISYVLIGLAAIFAVTSVIYPRVRTRGLQEAE